MSQEITKYPTGHRFTVQIPQTENPLGPYHIVDCTIISRTTEKVGLFVVVGDWLMNTFTLPVPTLVGNLPNSMYLSLCEIIPNEREEFLCTL
jgi:hypothetical protein